ncbi:MAG: cupin domain-containing protein [Chthoniobacterales bacterium]
MSSEFLEHGQEGARPSKPALFASIPNAAIIISMSEKENPWIDIVPGIKRRTIAAGATMYQMRAELAAGSRLPEHAHPQEQIAHVIKGQIRMLVAGVAHELGAGDAIYLASNVPHGVETIEDTTVIDTFSPPRADYLELDEKARRTG